MGLIAIVILGGVFALPRFLNDSSDISKTRFRAISTGSTGDGDVSMELTPHSVIDGILEVDIAVNTHSVDLTQFDLTRITRLEYNGKIVNPISAPRLSGHHSSGALKFKVEDKIEAFTIKISGIPKVRERVFAWN